MKFPKSKVDEALHDARMKHEILRPELLANLAKFGMGESAADAIWNAFERDFRNSFEEQPLQ